mmetsp:Transcript_45509/g.91855  ORF Transcript_45509/g.91855 Transcript_45509/m.91855 type:complete len:293 (+) Transcript_45509:689-1567(+)
MVVRRLSLCATVERGVDAPSMGVPFAVSLTSGESKTRSRICCIASASTVRRRSPGTVASTADDARWTTSASALVSMVCRMESSAVVPSSFSETPLSFISGLSVQTADTFIFLLLLEMAMLLPAREEHGESMVKKSNTFWSPCTSITWRRSGGTLSLSSVIGVDACLMSARISAGSSVSRRRSSTPSVGDWSFLWESSKDWPVIVDLDSIELISPSRAAESTVMRRAFGREGGAGDAACLSKSARSMNPIVIRRSFVWAAILFCEEASLVFVTLTGLEEFIKLLDCCRGFFED